jgi:hypothetical protein
MHPAGFLVAVVLAGASIVGCGSTTSVEPGDGSVPDGAGDSNSEEGGSLDASGPVDGSEAVDAEGEVTASEGGVDAALTTGTLVVSADAALNTSGTPGGRCAAADSLSVAPDETSVGYSMTLTASGIDATGGTSDVTLTWSMSGTAGSLSTPMGASNTFTCTAVGYAVITVTASIANGGATCATNGSLQATVWCDAL